MDNCSERFCMNYLQVLSATLNGFINCSCNHLTSFGGGLLVEPNPIDFDKVLVEFKNLEETSNVAVIVTVAVVFLCYFIALVIVGKVDKVDARNVSTFHSQALFLFHLLLVHRLVLSH